ncbi:zona pellucida sperm-binding protein 3-like isoform X15 [Brienomyrus brachyistius]|uniref:zona pellucida sperm-binding protein 3-like isoform X15 n=1 Tax=Brienomyrus brachyistius TaxID=42636 RepID=UPI0020B2CD61|nr:zona pellucida sperm-binding protein 3-like isoform X15 [Brienomyrus brachyistius]
MAVHEGVIVLLLLLGCSCEAQLKSGFLVKTPQVAAVYQNGLGAPQVVAAGYQVGVGAPQVASTGYQVGVGAPQVASTGYQVGVGAPQVSSTGYQVGVGAPQVSSTGYQVGVGGTGYQVGVGATKVGATGFQVGVGAPQVASTGFQVGVGGTGYQVGVGAPKVGAAGYLSKQVAPALVKSVTGMQVNPDSVRVVCGEDSVMVDVLQDLLAIGQLINASDITLGGCAPTGQDASGTVRFQSVLQACGSTLMMTADALVYSFALIYTPSGINGSPIVRTNGAVVGIECHYLRKQNVSSNALVPTWIPYYATMAAEAQLNFSLRLMDDAWQNERASNVYFLGSVLNIEASVLVGNSQPLRVFVDSCVATLVPDVTSLPSYAFVQNSGCLTDAKVTGSRSQFLPRKQDDKLQLQLDAFRFSQDGRSSLYITCSLRATVASVPVDSQHKACSFSLAANRWVSVDGNDQVCGCCDASCGLAGVAGAQGTGVLGPIAIQQGPPTASQPGQLYILKG